MKHLLLAAALLSALSLASPLPARAPLPVVLDTDIGSDIDDTWALAYLLRCPELDLKLVLCGTANTTYRARVAARFLQVAGRADVPVGLGPSGGSSNEHQLPWVADYPLSAYPGSVHPDGVAAFLDLVHASPTPLTLIAIGPLTNIAEALRRDPSIAPKVHFVGMHGSIDIGYGGHPPPQPEANVFLNVEAFRTVHAAPWKSFAITPLDTCGRVILEGEPYARLLTSPDPMIRALLDNYRIWLPLVSWKHPGLLDSRSSTLFDVVAVTMAFDTSLLEFETVPLVTTDEGLTRRDPAGRPTRAALRWRDLEAYYTHLSSRLLAAPGHP